MLPPRSFLCDTYSGVKSDTSHQAAEADLRFHPRLDRIAAPVYARLPWRAWRPLREEIRFAATATQNGPRFRDLRLSSNISGSPPKNPAKSARFPVTVYYLLGPADRRTPPVVGRLAASLFKSMKTLESAKKRQKIRQRCRPTQIFAAHCFHSAAIRADPIPAICAVILSPCRKTPRSTPTGWGRTSVHHKPWAYSGIRPPKHGQFCRKSPYCLVSFLSS